MWRHLKMKPTCCFIWGVLMETAGKDIFLLGIILGVARRWSVGSAVVVKVDVVVVVVVAADTSSSPSSGMLLSNEPDVELSFSKCRIFDFFDVTNVTNVTNTIQNNYLFSWGISPKVLLVLTSVTCVARFTVSLRSRRTRHHFQNLFTPKKILFIFFHLKMLKKRIFCSNTHNCLN